MFIFSSLTLLYLLRRRILILVGILLLILLIYKLVWDKRWSLLRKLLHTIVTHHLHRTLLHSCELLLLLHYLELRTLIELLRAITRLLSLEHVWLHEVLLLVLLLLLDWLLLLNILEALHPILLGVVQHLITFNMAQIAHVAHLSECIVVVEASLAGPVTDSLLLLLLLRLFLWVVVLLNELLLHRLLD